MMTAALGFIIFCAAVAAFLYCVGRTTVPALIIATLWWDEKELQKMSKTARVGESHNLKMRLTKPDPADATKTVDAALFSATYVPDNAWMVGLTAKDDLSADVKFTAPGIVTFTCTGEGDPAAGVDPIVRTIQVTVLDTEATGGDIEWDGVDQVDAPAAGNDTTAA